MQAAPELGFTRASSSTFAASSLVWEIPELRSAVTLQAGRAHVNNAVLLAVLAATAHSNVDWLIAVAPSRYKNSHTFQNLRQQLQQLQAATGIRLDLRGVTLVGFYFSDRQIKR